MKRYLIKTWDIQDQNYTDEDRVIDIETDFCKRTPMYITTCKPIPKV